MMLERHSSKILFYSFMVLFILIYFHFLKNLALPESQYNFLNKTKKITLHSGKSVTQTFTAIENNISQIRFATDNLSFPEKSSLELTLLDTTCSQVIRQKTFIHQLPRQGEYTLFSFPPLSESATHSYCFRILYTHPKEKKGKKPALLATDESYQNFIDRTLSDQANGKVYPGQTLFLRPAYTTLSLTGDIQALIERISQYKPDWAKDITLKILFSIFLLGSCSIAFFIIKLKEETK